MTGLATLCRRLGCWIETHAAPTVLIIIAVGGALRADVAASTYFQADEAWHALAANQKTLKQAYTHSTHLAHPPLFILALHFWVYLGHTEFVLRLLPVLAGTASLWFAYLWLAEWMGRAPAVSRQLPYARGVDKRLDGLYFVLLLSAGFDLRRDEPDLIHARGVPVIDDIGDVGERDIVIALHKHHFFGSSLEDVGQSGLQAVPRHIVLIDFETRCLSRPSINDLHDNGAIIRLLLGLILRWRLRHQSVQTFGR